MERVQSRGEAGRAARFGRALHGPRRRVPRRARRRSPRPWTVEVALRGRREAGAHDEEHRDRRGRAPLRAADPGARRGEAAHLGQPCGSLRALPRRLVVLGGGPIGSRARAGFARFGSKVTQVEMLPRIMIREDPEVSALVQASFEADGVDGPREPQGEAGGRRERREVPGRRSARAPRSASRSTRSCARSGAWPTPRATASRSWASRDEGPHGGGERVPADHVSQHLRLRRRGGPVPVHPHRGAHGVVRVGERALREVPQVQGRLLGDPVGDVHRAGGGARRAERDRRRRRRASPHEVVTYGIDDLDRAIADGEARGLREGDREARAPTRSSAPRSWASTPATSSRSSSAPCATASG